MSLHNKNPKNPKGYVTLLCIIHEIFGIILQCSLVDLRLGVPVQCKAVVGLRQWYWSSLGLHSFRQWFHPDLGLWLKDPPLPHVSLHFYCSRLFSASS